MRLTHSIKRRDGLTPICGAFVAGVLTPNPQHITFWGENASVFAANVKVNENVACLVDQYCLLSFSFSHLSGSL